MKIKLLCFALALAFPASLTQTARATVAFTVTPVAVSNTYNGSITLQVTGLTNGEPVIVQKFLDLNTNGLIDGPDLLVQQFSLTDGKAGMVIGGVTNWNVPGDTNTTGGTITTTLNFQNSDFIQNVTGQYLYKLSSPSGHFTPVTNNFNVTSFPYTQKFTGNVMSNGTSTTLPYSVVILFPPPRGNNHGPGKPLGAVVANNLGSYTILAPPGTYSFLVFKTNHVYNFAATPVVTLASNATVTTNLAITNATASITGKIVDAATNSIGLPGVFIPASSTDGLIAVGFSDTAGNFTTRVTSGQWALGSDDSGLIVHGYVGFNNDTNVNSGATNIILAYHKATALFYGSVKSASGTPFAGIDISAYDNNNNLYQSDGYSDTNGNYVVGIVGGLGSNDPWQVQISTGSDSGTPTNYLFSQPQSQQNGGTNVGAGVAVLQNFTGLLATNYITGNVQQGNGSIISGVGVSAGENINGTNYQTSNVDTDSSGNYTLTVANGNWSVYVSCNGGSDSLDNFLGNGNYVCPNNQNVNIFGSNGVANFVVQSCNGVVITTGSTLPQGEANVPYNQSLQASSCHDLYTWSQTGGNLPPGVSLSDSGQLYGTPSNGGDFSFTAQVMDGVGFTTNQQFSLSIINALQINTTSLPDGTNGSFYSQTLAASGGSTPYTWSLSLLSFVLPSNLSLSTDGVLSGTATTTGTFNFSVHVTDNLGGFVDQPLALNLMNTNLPPLSIATAGGGQIVVLWPASAGTNYTLQTTTNLTTGPWVTASNGVPQVSFIFTNTSPTVFYRLH